ncbi:putative target of rapamycin (TOR) kinase 1 [Trypanosoma cruzi]|uniref:Putative target of rapamycin (TOR) kinase 1 n=1 Tax=Trypanosoma cruzi TaxID=5693 RepID=A0A2V2X7G1_TRYCR|nr:putative target of rapamycin (TOR) kinase 1 [Trypanosoma cruzi]
MRHADAQFFNHRGNGGYSVTLFCMRRPFWAGACVPTNFSSRQRDGDDWHLTKGLCWRHPRRTYRRQRLVLGERLRHTIENNRKRIIKPTEKASAAIITDASLHGWGAVFIPDSGDVKIAGGKWERKPFLIMQAEARVVRLVLSAFSAILPPTMDVGAHSTSLQRAANKGSSK